MVAAVQELYVAGGSEGSAGKGLSFSVSVPVTGCCLTSSSLCPVDFIIIPGIERKHNRWAFLKPAQTMSLSVKISCQDILDCTFVERRQCK